MTEVPKVLFMMRDIEKSEVGGNEDGGGDSGRAADMNLTEQELLQEDWGTMEETTKKYTKPGNYSQVSFMYYLFILCLIPKRTWGKDY